MPKIILENVSKRWGNFVGVDKLNLVIEDRDFITLLGPSGCGKTTTLRMIAGLETPTEGKITIGDTVVFDSETGLNVPSSKRDIGFLFQNYALWPHMTVRQNISFGLENLKWKKDAIKARIDEMLTMLKIEQFGDRYPSELSGGQQQRVAIARTLAPKPKVLFMDEPLSNLDAKLRLEMRTELKRLHSSTDSTFVYVTHDQLEAMTLATKVCLINVGVLQQYEPPLDVYNYPANLFVADFVGNPTMNFIEATIENKNVGACSLNMLGNTLRFTTNDKFDNDVTSVIIGARPEFVKIGNNGIVGKIYATLPSGMETTVKLEINDNIVTSVVFGSIDFKLNADHCIDFVGDKILMFDAKTKQRIAIGSLSI